MTSPQLLARLGDLQQMMRDLLRGVPATQANRRFAPRLASLGWYLRRSVYRETYWLREVLTGDTDLTDRVRPLFTPGAMDPGLQSARLPPPDHLLNWAAEIQDEHLRRLATPGRCRRVTCFGTTGCSGYCSRKGPAITSACSWRCMRPGCGSRLTAIV